MKQLLLSLIALSLGFLTSGQSRVPEYPLEPASAGHLYYQNAGQVIDDTGGVRNDVLTTPITRGPPFSSAQTGYRSK